MPHNLSENPGITELKARFQEITDLQAVGGLLYWDQTTYMPAAGAAARGRQTALINQLSHQKLTDPRLGKLLNALRPREEKLPYDSDEAGLIRVARMMYERAIKVPVDFVADFHRHLSESFQVWTKARPQNDFEAVQPYLEKTLEFSRRYADFFPGYTHIADPLIEIEDSGMTVSKIQSVFNELRRELVPLVKQIAAKPPIDASCLHKYYPDPGQWNFAIKVIKQIGYDFERGRIDRVPHPYMTRFSINDVRITTRVKENDFSDALFSTIHEAGHALYEQGIQADYEATPLARGASSGLHESQSRLWENLVGRSRPFWRYFYPCLHDVFSEQLRGVTFDQFYKAINVVRPSLIRTDADEVTYNLHVMIRFDLELAMLEGKLAIKDLPEAWNARYQADLGIQSANHCDGVLQDIHWFSDYIGGQFQGYTLGNILSAQFLQLATDAHPQIDLEIEAGVFTTLHNWLKHQIYRHGRKYTAAELIERVTGGGINIQPYLKYLRKKYTDIYSL